MARTPIWIKIRSLFSHGHSTTWPGSIRRIVGILIACSFILAVIHLTVGVELARLQLNINQKVRCWDIDSAANLKHHGFLRNTVFDTTVKKLPVTFVNVDVMAGRKWALGPKYLYLESPHGVGTIVMSLLVAPHFLVLSLVIHFAAHFRSKPISYRIAMLSAALICVQFLIDIMSMTLFDNYLSKRSAVVGEACWRSDGMMEDLAYFGRWAYRAKIAVQVVGWLGIWCMAVYFSVVYSAAARGMLDADQEPVPLADLSGLATYPPAGRGGNANSGRPAGTSLSLGTQPTANIGLRTGEQHGAPQNPAATKQGQQAGELDSELNTLERLDREFESLQMQLNNQLARQREREHERQLEQANDTPSPFESHLEMEQQKQQGKQLARHQEIQTGRSTEENDVAGKSALQSYQEQLMSLEQTKQPHSTQSHLPYRQTEENVNPFTDPRNVLR